MHKPMLTALLPMALVSALVGCGGGSGNAQAGEDAALAALLQVQDLPVEAKTAEGLESGPCDPLQVLHGKETKAAKSPMFVISKVQLQEAVGIFAAEELAAAAYDGLNAKSRLACIQSFIGLQGLIVKVLSQHDLNAGDEARTVRFQVRQPETGRKSLMDIAAIRSGESVASLILLNTAAAPTKTFVDDVIQAAADQLTVGSGS